jgi:uncharacterized protein (DUF433 family)
MVASGTVAPSRSTAQNARRRQAALYPQLTTEEVEDAVNFEQRVRTRQAA